MSENTERPDLVALVAKWQPILRMSDWDFAIRYCRTFDMSADAAGDCNYLLTKRHCSIRICDPIDFAPSWLPPMDIELTVVHEMLHPYIAMFHGDGMSDQLEQFIHSMSSALVSLHRMTQCPTSTPSPNNTPS